jgi:hypothetical protein
MILFQSKMVGNVTITTNFKIMYTSLSKQQSLEEITELGIINNIRRFIVYKHLQKHTNLLLVRNPYLRLESFFKDKFRKNLPTSEKEEWQNCQKIFFESFSLRLNDTVQTKRNAFLNTSFEQFILMLPLTFMKNQHLFPQYLSLSFRIRLLKKIIKQFPILFDKILKLENQNDIEFLEQSLEINLTQRRNTSKDVKELINWNTEMIKIANKLYMKDFESFDYQRINVKR